MRSDMHKVIVEEPRHGGGRNKQIRRRNLPDELLPKYEGMRRPYTDRKWFGEHLGPLRRWLRSNIGRRWDEVYSEACQVIKPDNVVRAHIRTHMMEYVKRHTFMRDGEVWCFDHGREMPVRTLRGHPVWCQFYVHPETGILHEVLHRKYGCNWSYSSSWAYPKPASGEVCKWISEGILLLKIEGIWYELEVRPYQEAKEIPPFDPVFKLRLCDSHTWEAYGKRVHCIGKRQLSRAELKKHGVRNSGSPSGIHALLGRDTLERMQRSNGHPVRGRLQGRLSVLNPAPRGVDFSTGR